MPMEVTYTIGEMTAKVNAFYKNNCEHSVGISYKMDEIECNYPRITSAAFMVKVRVLSGAKVGI